MPDIISHILVRKNGVPTDVTPVQVFGQAPVSAAQQAALDAAQAAANQAAASEAATTAASVQPPAGFAASETIADFRVRVVSEHINLGDKRFGGFFNGEGDDTPAFAAAKNAYAQFYSQYGGRGPRFVIPGRGALLRSGPIDITNMHGASIRGAGGSGRGSLVIEVLQGQNFQAIKSSDPYTAPLTAFHLGPCLILGGGNNVSQTPFAHGLDLGAMFGCEFDVTVWRCADGIRERDSFCTTLNNPLINGQGGLACNRGLVQLEGELSKKSDGSFNLYENGLTIRDGIIGFCLTDGWRAENWTGTVANGVQSFGHGRHGLYVGDAPGGKTTCWPILTGASVDTCGNSLVRFGRGTSIPDHRGGALDLTWLGNTAGTGALIEADELQNVGISVNEAINSFYAAILRKCQRVGLNINSIVDYDKAVSGSPAIYLEDTVDCRIAIGRADARRHTTAASPTPSQYSVIEAGASKRNLITGSFDGVPALASNAAGDKSCFMGMAEGTGRLLNFTMGTTP